MHRRLKEKFQLNTGQDNTPHSTNRYNLAFAGLLLEGKVPYFVYGASIHPDEKIKLRVMPECVYRYFISLVLAKNSPYMKTFSDAVVRLIESGIVQLWEEDIVSRFDSPVGMKILSEDVNGNTDPEALRLENLQGAFLITAVGFLLASAVFIIETSVKLLSSKRSNCQQ